MDAPPPLDPAELADLEALAGAMIPASEAHGVPGADDPEILAVIAAHAAGAREALARLAASLGDGPGTLGALDRAELEARLVRSGGPEAGAVYALVLMHYYRDDRVMAALGDVVLVFVIGIVGGLVAAAVAGWIPFVGTLLISALTFPIQLMVWHALGQTFRSHFQD